MIIVHCSGGSLDLVKTNSDIENFRVATGSSSVMLARAAMWNVSIFSKQGPFPVEKVMEEYLKYVSFCVVYVKTIYQLFLSDVIIQMCVKMKGLHILS